MRDPFGLFQETISVSYANLLLEITHEYGIDAQTVLQDTGLVAAEMKQADAKMSAHQWSKLVVNALRLTENYRLGIEYGFKLRLTSHGALGFAFLSCADVESALSLCQQYFCTRIQNFTPAWHVDASFVYVYLDDVHPVKFGNTQQSDQLRYFLIESLLFGAIHFLTLFSQQMTENIVVFVDWAQSQDYEKVQLDPMQIHFNQPRNGFRFPKAYLSCKNPNSDQVAFQQAVLYCENDKVKLVKETTRDLQKSIKSELLYNSSNGYPTLALIAQRLNMSERTIKRHLQAQGTTFLQILAEVRFNEAKKLLQQQHYSIQDIAGLVGYEEATNFIRAFKKTFGETPSQYRKNYFSKPD
ncbi:AraC family transcriptional regulator [Acinetobacter sp. NIPH 2699]|uniref:AraC family transcriptional regulator n=1 Tax=Acinetobacter sp. NIPH 2699 TaxID=2923433 RepID=UPI001F4A90A7|nr:AraC family transcriptional regulator [Acinetobacter sp. NIPH 2699]MCH7337212.1 AraC family transcriptional regulator [Acinetobacter sp. NIPH 2699]